MYLYASKSSLIESKGPNERISSKNETEASWYIKKNVQNYIKIEWKFLSTPIPLPVRKTKMKKPIEGEKNKDKPAFLQENTLSCH